MPRDSSGLYTLPAGNPVVTNTVISSTWANSTLSDIAAQLNNVYTRDGLLGPTAPFKIVDGTVAQPGLAWNSEPGLGWFRPAAGVIGMAASGGETFRFSASSGTDSSFLAFPRALGSSSLNLFDNSMNAASYHQLSIWLNKDGIHFAAGNKAAANIQMSFEGAPIYVFDNRVQASGGAGGFITSGYYDDTNSNHWAYGLDVNPAWGVMYLRGLHVPGQYAAWRMGNGVNNTYYDFRMSNTDGAILILSGPNSQINAARLVGKADNASYADNAGYSNNSGALGGLGAGGYIRGDYCSDAGFVSQGQQPYFRRGDGGVYRLATLQNIGDQTFDGTIRVPQMLVSGGGIVSNGGTNWSHPWRWFWNGDVGDNHLYAYVDGANQGWATLNSDERLKEDIVPLESSESDFMKLAPINFRWKKINAVTNNERKMDGLSAQNVRAAFPMATFGDFDTPPDESGNIQFPGSVDDRAVLAHVILRVQNLINRVAALEAA